MKRSLCLVLCLILLLSFAACKEKGSVYSCEEMKITLPDGFVEVQTVRRGTSFESEYMSIKIVRESKSVVEDVAGYEGVTLEAYADLVLKQNRLDLPLTKKGSCLTYTYTAFDEEVSQNFTYYVTVHKSENAYWLVQFIVRDAFYSDYQAEIATYLASITFDE